jgi:uncharacterized protein YecT (DUF1311 family)
MKRIPAGMLATVALLPMCLPALVLSAQSSGQNAGHDTKEGTGQGSAKNGGQNPGQTPVETAARNPCALMTTMADLDVCSAEEFKKDDMDLNHLYRSALVTLEHELDDALKRSAKDEAGYANNAINDLKSAQEAWVKYRDLECRAAGQQYEGGTIQPLVVNQCLMLVTMHRIEEIQQAYEIGGRKLE